MKDRIKKEGDRVMLKCTKCLKYKDANDTNFFKSKKNLLGLSTYCKECYKLYSGDYYKLNKDRILSYTHGYYHSHTEQYYKNYRDKREKILEYHADYNKKNHDLLKEKRKSFYNNNKVNIIKNNKSYKTEFESKYGFKYDYFHRKTTKFISKNGLRPSKCTICGKSGFIEAHHPSYESVNDWNKVVFCCKSCHNLIHSGRIECPEYVIL